jgi:hypothetical protein
MKKLRLDIDALAVDTFKTGADADAVAGTVMANQAFVVTYDLHCPTFYTCPNTV